MIFRLSTKLAAKLKAAPPAVVPLAANPRADWSAHLFMAERTQFVIVTNTAALYSIVFPGRGLAHAGPFVERALSCLREFMDADGLASIYQRGVAPTSGPVEFSKALNRSVTSSMNDLIYHAKVWLTEGGLSPHDVGFKLNNIPFSQFKYMNPREVFTTLMEDEE